MTICPHCGGENHAGKIKCHHCGRVLGDLAPPAEDRTARSMRRIAGRMPAAEISLDTRGQRVMDITEQVTAFAEGLGSSGLVNIFIPHATAGVGIMETGSGSEADLGEVIDRLFPSDDRYAHQHGATGHGRDHVLPMFISPSLSIPSTEGRMLLGQWQRVVFVDTNEDNNERRIRLSFLSGVGAE